MKFPSEYSLAIASLCCGVRFQSCGCISRENDAIKSMPSIAVGVTIWAHDTKIQEVVIKIIQNKDTRRELTAPIRCGSP